MKASIILFVYNQERTVGRAIESLLRQQCTYPWEIVVADDASPDRTREICQSYADRHPDLIRMLPLEPNKGIVGNYFDAVEACRGEYVGDCAGDDEWVDPTRLQRSIEMLDADPTLSVVFTDVEEQNGTSRSLHSGHPAHNRFFRPRVTGREILVGVLNNVNSLPFLLSAALYRRSALLSIYNKERSVVRMPEVGVEDVPVIAALGASGDAAYLPVVGYRYYVDGESASNNLSQEKAFRFTARVTKGNARLATYYGVPPSRLRAHIRAKLLYLAGLARQLGDPALLPEIEECRRAWGVPLPLRAHLHLLLLRLGYRKIPR